MTVPVTAHLHDVLCMRPVPPWSECCVIVAKTIFLSYREKLRLSEIPAYLSGQSDISLADAAYNLDSARAV